MAYGYKYTMGSDSLFTAINGFPTGFDSGFTVSVGGQVLGTFSPGDTVDFTGFPGGGVASFEVTGISPATDPEDPTAFPLRVAFSTLSASFAMESLTEEVPEVIQVEIDIKPGSYPNSINVGSNGSVPVAILSAPEFDAKTVDPLTLILAGADVRIKGKGTAMASFEDVNGDGLTDLVVHVSTAALQLTNTDSEATLTGTTYDGQQIEGRDSVRIVP